MARTILVVDDDPDVRTSIASALEGRGTAVNVAETAPAALARLADDPPELVLSDVRMPGMDGLELLGLLKERAPGVDVVLMTAYESLPTVVEAMRGGASDFLVKPLDLHQLRVLVDRIFADRATRAAGRSPEPGPTADARKPADGSSGHRLVGRDPSMVSIFKVVGQMAGSRATVVIRGESGTGKELIARAIHHGSESRDAPFVAVNCTALPEGLLESELFGHVKGSFTGAVQDREGRFALAGAGTVFLDEIGDTTPAFQAKLLRVLQEGEFYPVGAEAPRTTEARVLAATHRDLEAMVEAGNFREDLYYRLRVVEIRVPPLRERMGDVPLLAEHLLEKAARKSGSPTPVLSDEARTLLLAHDWPGNVRELENCLTRAAAVATGGVVHPEHLALERGRTAEVGLPELASMDEVEASHVTRVLTATGGNRTRAAEILGVSRPRLLRMIERHGIDL